MATPRQNAIKATVITLNFINLIKFLLIEDYIAGTDTLE
jgi:hypothetical protein